MSVWFQVWLPISQPSDSMRISCSSCPAMLSPLIKKVARTPFCSRMSKTLSVMSVRGPSSNVYATIFCVGSITLVAMRAAIAASSGQLPKLRTLRSISAMCASSQLGSGVGEGASLGSAVAVGADVGSGSSGADGLAQVTMQMNNVSTTISSKSSAPSTRTRCGCSMTKRFFFFFF